MNVTNKRPAGGKSRRVKIDPRDEWRLRLTGKQVIQIQYYLESLDEILNRAKHHPYREPIHRAKPTPTPPMEELKKYISASGSEVILCVNCKEEVPVTLYCLNCGFPLYHKGEAADARAYYPDYHPEPKPLPDPEPEIWMWE